MGEICDIVTEPRSDCFPIKRLVRRKVCFILDAGSGRWRMLVQRLTPHPQSGARAFIDREGATCKSSPVISDSHLQIGPRWSDQHHLGCFRYS